MNELIKLLLIKWIELKSNGERKNELLKELESSNKFNWVLGKSTSGNDILGVEFYSPSRIEVIKNSVQIANFCKQITRQSL